MIIEYRPLLPVNGKGFRLYADNTCEGAVDNDAPHVGTNLLNGEPVEVYWWSARHGWFEKQPELARFTSCWCKSCVAAVRR